MPLYDLHHSAAQTVRTDTRRPRLSPAGTMESLRQRLTQTYREQTIGKSMKKLLVAIRPQDFPMISIALGTEFDIVVCTSLAEAQAMLNDDIGLIACGVHFDDGRIFDLLRHVRANPKTETTPFFSIMGAGRELSPAILKSIRSAAAALGADGFINLAGLIHKFGEEEAYAVLRDGIRKLLPRDAGGQH